MCLGSEGPDFAGLSDRTAPARRIPLMSPAAGLKASVSFFTSLHAAGRRGAGVAPRSTWIEAHPAPPRDQIERSGG